MTNKWKNLFNSLTNKEREAYTKLTELEPKLTENYLRFDCPTCRTHSIRIALKGEEALWTITGTLENLTVTPSINAETPPICKAHFFIINGEIKL